MAPRKLTLRRNKFYFPVKLITFQMFVTRLQPYIRLTRPKTLLLARGWLAKWVEIQNHLDERKVTIFWIQTRFVYTFILSQFQLTLFTALCKADSIDRRVVCRNRYRPFKLEYEIIVLWQSYRELTVSKVGRTRKKYRIIERGVFKEKMVDCYSLFRV